MSLLQRAWYQLLRALCILGVSALFCFRSYRRERIPSNGPVLLLANHQSNLDPVLVGVASRRPLSYLARKSLFHGPFALLIRSVNAIPLDRDGMSIAGIREIVRRLKQGEATLVFPEGTRTFDGNMGPLQSGFGVLARRSGATIVPLGIDGAYRAWPRTRRLPRPARITVHVGRPIPPSMIAASGDDYLVALVQRRIAASVRIAAALNRTAMAPNL